MTMSLLRHNNVITERSAWRDVTIISQCRAAVQWLERYVRDRGVVQIHVPLIPSTLYFSASQMAVKFYSSEV